MGKTKKPKDVLEEATISSYQIVNDSTGKDVVFYEIQSIVFCAKAGGKIRLTNHRRFNEFQELSAEVTTYMKEEGKHGLLPAPPSKSWFFTNHMDKEFIMKRATELNTYVKSLATLSQFKSLEMVLNFVGWFPKTQIREISWIFKSDLGMKMKDPGKKYDIHIAVESFCETKKGKPSPAQESGVVGLNDLICRVCGTSTYGLDYRTVLDQIKTCPKPKLLHFLGYPTIFKETPPPPLDYNKAYSRGGVKAGKTKVEESGSESASGSDSEEDSHSGSDSDSDAKPKKAAGKKPVGKSTKKASSDSDSDSGSDSDAKPKKAAAKKPAAKKYSSDSDSDSDAKPKKAAGKKPTKKSSSDSDSDSDVKPKKPAGKKPAAKKPAKKYSSDSDSDSDAKPKKAAGKKPTKKSSSDSDSDSGKKTGGKKSNVKSTMKSAKYSDDSDSDEGVKVKKGGKTTQKDDKKSHKSKKSEKSPKKDTKPGETKPIETETKPVETKPEDVTPVEAKPEETKPEVPKMEEPKVEEPKVEEPKVEEPKVEEPKPEIPTDPFDFSYVPTEPPPPAPQQSSDINFEAP